MSILSSLLLKILPRKRYLELKYRRAYGRKANLSAPKLFTEKLFLLKYYNQKYFGDEINRLHDKLQVRDYVKEVVGEKYLSKIYGVYDTPEQIEFDKLPEKFVLKLTKMNGMNMACMDKRSFDIARAKDTFNQWIKVPEQRIKYSEEAYTFAGDVKIISEESLFINKDETPVEYCMFCFNGKVKMIVLDDVITDKDGNIAQIIRNVYDLDWNLTPVDFGRKRDENRIVEKPGNLEELIEVSEKLAKPFPFVRVDLYNIDGRIVFREMTFIPMGGVIKIDPLSFDEEMGTWVDVSKYN